MPSGRHFLSQRRNNESCRYCSQATIPPGVFMQNAPYLCIAKRVTGHGVNSNILLEESDLYAVPGRLSLNERAIICKQMLKNAENLRQAVSVQGI